MNQKILLIEDDRDLALSISEYLECHQIDTDYTHNGQTGQELASNNRYDAILLDLQLPKVDGLTISKTLRSYGISTPILMITARDTLNDKLAGFEAGADDYLVKPFALVELVLRIQSLAKWQSGQSQILQIGKLKLDLQNIIAWREQHQLKLTPCGYKLLEVLMRNSPRVVSKDELEQALWSKNIPDSNALKVHLYHLRQQVDKPFEVAMIRTVPSQGFVLVSD